MSETTRPTTYRPQPQPITTATGVVLQVRHPAYSDEVYLAFGEDRQRTVFLRHAEADALARALAPQAFDRLAALEGAAMGADFAWDATRLDGADALDWAAMSAAMERLREVMQAAREGRG